MQSFGDNEGKVEHESFPTLESVLLSLDSSCGFNIEVGSPGIVKDIPIFFVLRA